MSGKESALPRWERLSDTAGVYTLPDCRFTTDTLLLADFSLPAPGARCADLGTGCGTIPAIWLLRGAPAAVLGLELLPELAALAQRSMARNGFSAAEIVCGDLRDYRALLPHQALDLAACNPPYYPPGRGLTAAGSRGTARHGEGFGLALLAEAARFTLRDGGRLCLCLPAPRLAEAAALFSGAGLEPKRLRLVQSRPEKDPYLFLLECRKGGRPGLAVQRSLVLCGSDGRPTPECLAAYGDYAVTEEA